MNGFVAGGTTAENIIGNNGWWPDIDANDVRDTLRLDGAVTEARLEAALINAMLSVNRELAVWQASQQATGYASADAVPGELIAEETALIHHYRRAVYSTAGAELCERYRDYDSTSAGNARADKIEPGVDDYRRDARWAISDILGLGRSTVELI